jgi:hypothetical protein
MNKVWKSAFSTEVQGKTAISMAMSYATSLSQLAKTNALVQSTIVTLQNIRDMALMQKLIRDLTAALTLELKKYTNPVTRGSIKNAIGVLNAMIAYWTSTKVGIICPTSIYSQIRAVVNLKMVERWKSEHNV